MVAMSHQCQQKRNRTRILRYFEAVLGEPKEKHRPHPAATSSRQAQESPRAGDPQKTVVKVKRKKTRRELNRAKFGKLFRCKAPARPSQAVPAADQCRRRVVGSSRAPIPKPSHNPGWIITQNRLTQHMGIFNKKVKSMDIERLLKGEPARERSPEPAAEVAADVAQDRSCTSAQAEATTPPQRPDPRTPLGDDQCDARASSAAPVEMGGQRPPKPTRQESPPPPLPPPPPTTDLARRLVRTLKPHRLVPGQSLVHSTQRQLVDILVERHGGQPGTWLPAELTRAPQSGFIAPDRAVAGGGFISPTAQAKEDSFLLQSDGSARGRLSSTASTVVNEAFLPDQVKGVDPGRRKQDAGSFAGEKLLPSLDLCPPRGSPPGGCAGNGGAFYPDPWPWSHVGGLRQAAQRRGPSPPARSHSAGSSLARVLEAHRALVQERRSSPCRNPGKGLWSGEALAAGDGPSGIRQAPWHDDQRPGREQPEGGKYRPCFPPASPWPFAQKPPLDGGDRPRRSWAGEKDAANPGPSQLLPPRRSSAWLPDPLPENRAHPRGSAGRRGGPAHHTGAPDWRASGLPISLCYPPSETLEWSDSSPPSWLSVAHRLWQKKSPEEWTFHRMRMF